MDRVNLTTVTTAKGPGQQEMVGMFLVEQIHNGIPVTKQGYLYRKKITKSEMTLQLLVNAVYIICKANIEFDTVEMYIDEQIVSNAFVNKWIENWAENDWKNARGNEIKNVETWQQLYELLSKKSKRFIFAGRESQYTNWMRTQSERRIIFEQKKEKLLGSSENA